VVRDILFHFDAARAAATLRRIHLSGCRFALITTFPMARNTYLERKFRPGLGFLSYAGWNLEDAPFSLPRPLVSLGRDSLKYGRVMALWPCASLVEAH